MEWILDREAMRCAEREAMEKSGLSSALLMEHAAMGIAAAVLKRHPAPARILFLCGAGNNGADALAAARLLSMEGYYCLAAEAFPEKKGTPEYEMQKKAAQSMSIPVCGPEELEAEWEKADIIVDGLFGIGLKREVTGTGAELIERANECGALKIAVDLPSGIEADSGRVLGTAFRADFTVTFGFAKIGLCLYPGREYAGEQIVCGLGIPVLPSRTEGKLCRRLAEDDLSARLPLRRARSNKGTYGKVLVIAGSRNMAGAAYFSARAALLSGCGMVRILTPSCNREILQTLLPEALLTTWEEGDYRKEILQTALSWADAAVIGPGLSTGEEAAVLVRDFLQENELPAVLDADALNILSLHPEWRKYLRSNMILTPHPGEFSRMTDISAKSITEDLLKAAENWSKENPAVLVLKDAASVISCAGEDSVINGSGCHAMATAGSGDVLTGICGAFLAAGKTAFEAAALGAFVHGKAGEAAAEKCGAASCTASDIAEGLSEVLKHYR